MHHAFHTRALREGLGLKARHRQRAHAEPELPGLLQKLPPDTSIAQRAVERRPVAQPAHIDLDPVGPDLVRERKGAELLSFQQHPITDGDAVTLPGGREGQGALGGRRVVVDPAKKLAMAKALAAQIKAMEAGAGAPPAPAAWPAVKVPAKPTAATHGPAAEDLPF